MGRFKEYMREARAILHEEMSEAALYFRATGDAAPRSISVRVHDKWRALGDLKGTNFNYAEIEQVAPVIIFWRAQIEPMRGAYVAVEPGVVYRIDNVSPHDDQTISATVVRLSKAEAAPFPSPEG